MKKLAFCLVLVSVCSFSFVGCAKKTDKPVTPTTPATSPADDTEPAADATKPAETKPADETPAEPAATTPAPEEKKE